jgi:hypothetical protein
MLAWPQVAGEVARARMSEGPSMSDPNKPEDAKADDAHLRQAHKGVKDTDEIVTGALGEPIPGAVADTTDGDR